MIGRLRPGLLQVTAPVRRAVKERSPTGCRIVRSTFDTRYCHSGVLRIRVGGGPAPPKSDAPPVLACSQARFD